MKRIVSTLIVLGILMTGTIFGDNLIINPGFETQTPAFWSPLNGTMGVDVDWVQAPSPVYGGFYSFMVSKGAATSTPVGWISDNNADLFWNNASAGTYALSAYVKTVGVNTSPANDDAKIGLSFVFLDASDAELYTANVWADQSTADGDWAQITGAAILATEPASVVISAFMGKDATGSVYFDNIGCGTDPWSMGLFNGDAETIEGWLSWYAGNNGSYGTVTSGAAHTGTYGAELFKPDTNVTNTGSEIVYYSIPTAVEPGEWYKIGVWVKTEGVNTADSLERTNILTDRLDQQIALCYFFHKNSIETAWDLSGGDKFVYIDQTTAATNWMHYEIVEQAPDDATGISVRARFTSFPTGKAYFDNFSVYQMILADPALGVDDAGGVNQVPTGYGLNQNYPNPFNPMTTINFELPQTSWITLTVYNLLGQKIATLADGIHEQGRFKVIWNGLDGMQQQVPSGVYIYSLRSEEIQINKKMILLR